jgi:hypothetical protein
MDDPHDFETLLSRQQQIFLDYTLDITRLNRVQIEDIRDRYLYWLRDRIFRIHT